MKLPADVLQKTILAMFAIRDLQNGDMVCLSRFEEFWARIPLRRSDLLDGLADVCSRGWIEIEEHSGETFLVLSPRGEFLARTIVASGVTDIQLYVREQVFGPLRLESRQANALGVGRRGHED